MYRIPLQVFVNVDPSHFLFSQIPHAIQSHLDSNHDIIFL